MTAKDPAQGSARRGGAWVSYLADPPLLHLVLLLLAAFLLTRLPFFWYYGTVRLSQDSGSYLDVVKELQAHHWPRFVFRTPGYPLFIWMASLLSERWIVLIYIQNVLTFAASVALVSAVRGFRPRLALPAAVALCGYAGSSQVLLYDVSLLSDSLYASVLVFTVAALVSALGRGGGWRLAGASAWMALAILVRPAAMYLVVIYGVVLAYLAWNRAPARGLLAFAVPLPAALLALCTYNALTLSQFVITPFGEANIAGATALFWEQDPSLPPEVNRALEGLGASYAKVGITPENLRLVRTSWDPDALFDVYIMAYNRLVWSAGWGSGTRFGSGSYMGSRRYIKQVSMLAIRKHPTLYARWVWANMVVFFRGVGYTFDVESALAYRGAGPAATRTFDSGAAHAEGPGGGAREGEPLMERTVESAQRGWQAVHGFVFQRVVWSWACGAMLLASAVQLARHRGRHLGALILLVLTLMPLGAGLVVCLVETALDRYSYATQFIYYLAVALAPLLWVKAAPRQT